MKKQGTTRWMLRTNRKWIPALLLLLVCNVAMSLFGVWFALGTRRVVDAVTGSAPDKQAFISACVQQGILIVATILTGALIHHLKDQLTAKMDMEWKRTLLHGLLRGEYSAVTKYHTGELLNLMNHDVSVLITSLLNILPSVASMATKLIAALTVLIALEPMLTAVVVVAGIAVVLVSSVIRRRLKSLNKRSSEAQGKVSGFIQETMEKLLMVQAMDIAEVMENRSDKLLAERYELHRKRKNVSLVSSTFMNILAYGASFGSLVWCSSAILAGQMTYGTMMAINNLVAQVRIPFTNMSRIGPQYAAMCAAAERLQELESICNTATTERKEAAPIYEKMTGIRGEALTFAYDRDYVLEDADFFLPKGSFGVIVGHSGIGKSTLLKLLLGIFPPASGRLFLDGEEDVTVDYTTRRLFTYVPQGNLLLSGSLRDNLLVTNPDATQEEINRAIHISAMDDYLHTLPEGLETVVGENALGLSEGQAQRLSIARAVLSNAPILLLDEATSALDDATERAVLQRIRELPDKTCIAVTHRPAATDVADWALEMKEGKCTVRMLH